MSLTASRLVDFSPRPQPRAHRVPTDAVRVLVCKLVAFFQDEGCRAMPAPNWLTVVVADPHAHLTLEVLSVAEPDPAIPGRVPVRSVKDARAAALRAGILDDATGASA